MNSSQESFAIPAPRYGYAFCVPVAVFSLDFARHFYAQRALPSAFVAVATGASLICVLCLPRFNRRKNLILFTSRGVVFDFLPRSPNLSVSWEKVAAVYCGRTFSSKNIVQLLVSEDVFDSATLALATVLKTSHAGYVVVGVAYGFRSLEDIYAGVRKITPTSIPVYKTTKALTSKEWIDASLAAKRDRP